MAASIALSASLDDVLTAREQRVVRQQAALATFGKAVLSLTLVSPGPIKDSPQLRFVFAEALAAIDNLLADRQWQALAREHVTLVSGQEAIIVVDCPAQSLKWALTGLEDQHPLGRLWDMDVICPETQRGISRQNLLLAPRKCLVCGEAAHACARSRAHTLEDLLSVIEEQIHAYRRSLVE